MKKKFYLLFALVALALNVLAQKNVKTITVNGVSFDMVLVKGGTFTMGCNEEKDGEKEEDKILNNEMMLDGSSIKGFRSIETSDMYFYPDINILRSKNFLLYPKMRFRL